MLGLRRLRLDAVWIELLPATADPHEEEKRIHNFQRRLREHGLQGRYCLLCQRRADDAHELGQMRCIGISRRELRERLAGPNTLLNLSYSLHPPFLLEFERRIFCDLDPSEIFFWMTKMEMGQSHHHEFWTIGLNVHAADCRLPQAPISSVCEARTSGTGIVSSNPLPARRLQWRTFYPLVDTKLLQPRPRPRSAKFSTIGQWYWGGAVEVDGEFPDLSKKRAFEPYLDLPRRIPGALFELAMNLNAGDPEIARLQRHGWHVVSPHRVVRTPGAYRRYLASALGEFTAIKGVDVAWRTGWLSDRAAAFLALGRPVITEDTAARKHLPPQSGFSFVSNIDEAETAANEVLSNWERLSKQARDCAVENFDSAKNLRRILDL